MKEECKICAKSPMDMVKLEDQTVVCLSCFNMLADEGEIYVLTREKRSWCPEWLFWMFEGTIKYPPFRQIFTKKV